jgi:hypothetical protein
MSVADEVRALLVAHQPLLGLVGQRVIQNVAGLKTEPPYLVYSLQEDPVLGIDAVAHVRRCSVTVECWALTSVAADAVADAAKAALDAAPPSCCVSVQSRSSGHNEETNFHGSVLTVEWWSQ